MNSIPLINDYKLIHSPVINLEKVSIHKLNKQSSSSSQLQPQQQQQLQQQQQQQLDNALINLTSNENKFTLSKVILFSWGVLGVIMLIINALQRLLPVALQPILQKDLTSQQSVIYILFMLYMIYVEGYKAFHLKFSPLVVSRALHLSENPTILNCLLAGPYCMGLFGATKKRMIVSWGVTIGVFGLVKIVKLLPYPWRSIVDGGVVCGLTFGTLSMIYYYLLALLGFPPSISSDLPSSNEPSSLSPSSSVLIENKQK